MRVIEGLVERYVDANEKYETADLKRQVIRAIVGVGGAKPGLYGPFQILAHGKGAIAYRLRWGSLGVSVDSLGVKVQEYDLQLERLNVVGVSDKIVGQGGQRVVVAHRSQEYRPVPLFWEEVSDPSELAAVYKALLEDEPEMKAPGSVLVN